MADSGYASEANFQALESLEATAYITQAKERGKTRTIDPDKHSASQRMADRMATAEGHDHYRRRKFIPEPVFGWIKAAMGFRHFSVRGLRPAIDIRSGLQRRNHVDLAGQAAIAS